MSKIKSLVIDPQYFENINCPYFIYFLGYFWADGHVSSHPTRFLGSMKLIETDFLEIQPILEKFSKFNYRKIPAKFKNGTKTNNPALEIKFRQSDLINFLKQNDYHLKSGCSPNKILQLIPPALRNHWWRGYFDGDGCIYTSPKRGTSRLCFCSCFEQDWSFAEYLPNIKFNIQRHKSASGNKSYLSIQNKLGIETLFNFLFNDSFIGLTRKYYKFQFAIQKMRSNEKKFKSKLIPIKVFDLKKNLVGNFPSLTSACKSLNLHLISVRKVLKGELPSHKNFIFEFN